MLIDSCIASSKTQFLIDKYVQLVNEGVSTSSILALVQNSTLKNKFQNEVFEKLKVDCVEKPKIHSFFHWFITQFLIIGLFRR